jgi:hypothetical protein
MPTNDRLLHQDEPGFCTVLLASFLTYLEREIHVFGGVNEVWKTDVESNELEHNHPTMIIFWLKRDLFIKVRNCLVDRREMIQGNLVSRPRSSLR